VLRVRRRVVRLTGCRADAPGDRVAAAVDEPFEQRRGRAPPLLVGAARLLDRPRGLAGTPGRDLGRPSTSVSAESISTSVSPIPSIMLSSNSYLSMIIGPSGGRVLSTCNIHGWRCRSAQFSRATCVSRLRQPPGTAKGRAVSPATVSIMTSSSSLLPGTYV